MTQIGTTKDGDLQLDGETVAPDSLSTWDAGTWAKVIGETWRTAYVAGAQAGATAGVDWAKANALPTSMAIVSMPARVTRSVVKRDNRGQIIETVQVQEDVP